MGQRLLAHDQIERRQQHAGLRRDPHPGVARDPRGVLADRLAVETAVREEVGPDLVAARLVQQSRLLPVQFPEQPVRDRVLHHENGLVGAQQRVVEGLAVGDPAGCGGEVGGLIHEHGNVAGAHAQRRVP